jgi:hypothetical protein
MILARYSDDARFGLPSEKNSLHCPPAKAGKGQHDWNLTAQLQQFYTLSYIVKLILHSSTLAMLNIEQPEPKKQWFKCR